MQKNLRRLIAVLLAIATVASFSSCNLIMRFLFEEEGETPIGDEVSFLSEKLDGKVTSIIDANTVNVYCDVYGFEIPASVNDLVVTKSTLGEATTITQSGAQNSTINTAPTNTVFIALVPDDYNNLQTYEKML